MRFDTEEAFFRAAYNASRTSPAYIAEACRLEKYQDESDWQKALRTEVVRLMRGAFNAHQRADSQYIGDSLLEHRLNEAKDQLPEGWRLVVMAERGVIRLDIYGPDDERHEFASARDSLSGQASDALRAALAKATGVQP